MKFYISLARVKISIFLCKKINTRCKRQDISKTNCQEESLKLQCVLNIDLRLLRFYLHSDFFSKIFFHGDFSKITRFPSEIPKLIRISRNSRFPNIIGKEFWCDICEPGHCVLSSSSPTKEIWSHQNFK